MSEFPTKENPQACKNECGAKIYLSNKNESKRYLPYELDGTVHDCPKKVQNGKLADTTTKATNTTDKEQETKFTQNEINVVEHLLSKMKSMKVQDNK